MDFRERYFPPGRSVTQEHELGMFTWFGYARLLKEMGTCSVLECGQGTAFVLVHHDAYVPTCVYHVCDFATALGDHDGGCPKCSIKKDKPEQNPNLTPQDTVS